MYENDVLRIVDDAIDLVSFHLLVWTESEQRLHLVCGEVV